MNTEQVIASLGLPTGIRLDQRIPKKLLLEQGVPTAADKRAIQDGLDELLWVAALKPGNVGVPIYKDEAREYLEVHVITASLRQKARVSRLSELIHRAVPYPVFLVVAEGKQLFLSLAHKRRSRAESQAVVLDGTLQSCAIAVDSAGDVTFLNSLAIVEQPSHNLFTLYQGWLDCLAACLAARITGRFTRAPSPEQATARDRALEEHARLQQQRIALRSQAAREKQLNRRAELNLQLQKLDRRLTRLLDELQ